MVSLWVPISRRRARFLWFRKRQHPFADLIGQGLMRFLGVGHGPVGDGERRVRIVDVLLWRVAQNPSEMAKVIVWKFQELSS